MEWATESGFVVVQVTALTVAMVVVFHYEVIQLLNRRLLDQEGDRVESFGSRPVILITIFVLLFAHIAEIWLFGLAYHYLLGTEGFGAINGYEDAMLLDCVYFSAATYTTVGWGDLFASGDIRFLAGTEALVGFMMVTWSASFSYLTMFKTWGHGD